MELYKIEPLSLISFITESKYRLPRYQRKDTWNDKQYFGLCVSVFQGYPIGVCIINSSGNTRWLLDGRQRRTCLQQLYSNPVRVYDWAKKFCKFKQTADVDDVRSAFWKEIYKYLGADSDSVPATGDKDDASDETSSEDTAESTDLDPVETMNYQNSNLKKLLNLILMVHQKKNKGNSWFTAFDFTKWFNEKNISYYKDADNPNGVNKEIIPELLSSFIRDTASRIKDDNGEFNQKKFIETVEDITIFKDDGTPQADKHKIAFEKHVDHYWERIKNSYQAISDLDDVLGNARVGMIILTGVQTFDAQNIFSRINSGGTQLKAAELLSAKPYWNSAVHVSEDAKKNIKMLYHKLNIQTDSNYVRWDIPATLVSRIDDKNLFFSSKNSDPAIEEVDTEEISIGFKIFSACYVDGISKISLDKLESTNVLDWSDSFEQFSRDLSNLIELIGDAIPEILVLGSWNATINDILGFAPTVELLAVAYKRWTSYGKPGYTTQKGKAFISEFKNHFDRLIIEKASGKWKGSGDSRVAFNISLKNIMNRVAPISDDENMLWDKYVEGAVCGSIDGQVTKIEMLRPLLYYAKVIKNELPVKGDKDFEIDHIYPQALFDSNGNVNSCYKESLTNLAILSAGVNSAKKDKKLNAIDSKYSNAIFMYESVDKKDFDLYSDVQNFDKLMDSRGEEFKIIFSSERMSYLTN